MYRERWTQEDILRYADPGWIKSRKTGHNETTIWYEDRIAVRFYSSEILTVYPADDGFIVFDNDSYNTRSTAQHMNKALERLAETEPGLANLKEFYVHKLATCVHYKDQAFEIAWNSPCSLTWEELQEIDDNFQAELNRKQQVLTDQKGAI